MSPFPFIHPIRSEGFSHVLHRFRHRKPDEGWISGSFGKEPRCGFEKQAMVRDNTLLAKQFDTPMRHPLQIGFSARSCKCETKELPMFKGTNRHIPCWRLDGVIQNRENQNGG